MTFHGLFARLQGQEHSANGVRGAPLVFEDVQADVAVVVHVWVEARRLKAHRRRFERVLCARVSAG